MTFATDDYDEEFSSFYIRDRRIDANSVIGIYIKSFYSNTGDAYYTPIKMWADSKFFSDNLVVQILENQVRFFDPNENLARQTLVVAILIP